MDRVVVERARAVGTLDAEHPVRSVNLMHVPGPDRGRLDQPRVLGPRRELLEPPDFSVALDELDPGIGRLRRIGPARTDCADDPENAEDGRRATPKITTPSVYHGLVASNIA